LRTSRRPIRARSFPSSRACSWSGRSSWSGVSITPDGRQGSLTPSGLVERLGNWADAGTHHTIFSVRGVWDIDKLELIGRDVIPQVRGLGEPSPLDAGTGVGV
jgi:hypothetical protein